MRATASHGFTLIELLFVVAIIGILSAIAVPALSRTRMAANEASAIASLRAIHSGQQAFWSSCGSGRYSPSLDNLSLVVAGAPPYVSPDIGGPAPVVKSGYQLEVGTTHPVAGTSCNGGTLVAAYYAAAAPVPAQGNRYFGTNGSGAIYESTQTLTGVMPDSGIPPAPARPIQR